MKDYDFPFGIKDVYLLIEDIVPLRRELSDNWYVDCMYCRDADGEKKAKGKMSISFIHNTFRCNRCGRSGGMLQLYADARGLSTYDDAYAEIRDRLHLGGKPDTGTKTSGHTNAGRCLLIREHNPIPQSQKASPVELHRTFSAIMQLLPLAEYHREKLITERGLTSRQVDMLGYGSIGDKGFPEYFPDALERRGYVLQGVPGGYLDSQGNWRLHYPNHCAGIVTPAISPEGLIGGLQVRLDHPIEKTKCLWVSSSQKPYGVTSGSPVHCAGEPYPETVYLTEGIIKGDISHLCSGKTVYSIAGVNQYDVLYELFPKLKRNGVAKLISAYDMDLRTNENVRRGLHKMFEIAIECGFRREQLGRLKWNPHYNGLDDWFMAMAQSAQKKQGG